MTFGIRSRWLLTLALPTGQDGVLRAGPMYPDRTLDGMMIGMRTMMTLGSVLSSPVVVGGVVYFGSTDGHLYAVR